MIVTGAAARPPRPPLFAQSKLNGSRVGRPTGTPVCTGINGIEIDAETRYANRDCTMWQSAATSWVEESDAVLWLGRRQRLDT